jgi:hypothetical protein
MIDRVRMAKTLGGLAGSMMLGAALLSWMEPAYAPDLDHRRTAELLETIRHAVTETPPSSWSAWQTIEVAAAATPGRLLLASPGQHPYHFLVDEGGSCTRTDHWSAQRPIHDARDTIRIGVVQPRAQEPMSGPQAWVVASLIETLSTVGGQPSTMPVRLDGTWSQVYGLDPEAVFELRPADSEAATAAPSPQ